MEATAYYFPNASRQPAIIIVATNEFAAMAEFEKISGRIWEPMKTHQVIIATTDLMDVLRVQQVGNTPKRPYEAVNELEFPLLAYFGGGALDTSETAMRWDIEAKTIQEHMPYLRIEDGEDLRQQLITEMDRWERKYRQ